MNPQTKKVHAMARAVNNGVKSFTDYDSRQPTGEKINLGNYNYITNKQALHTLSHKDIKVSRHAMQRAEERFGITKQEELRKLAASAKKRGICLNGLNEDNYTDFGITHEFYKAMKNKFRNKTSANKVYFYKEKFFVFNGNHSRTLTTIVDLSQVVK